MLNTYHFQNSIITAMENILEHLALPTKKFLFENEQTVQVRCSRNTNLNHKIL